MRKNRKLVKKMCLSAALAVGILGSAAVVNADSFTTTGGKYNKTWNVSLSVAEHGGTIYRLTGTATQPGAYKFDDVSITVTQYCNNANNSVKTANATDAYTISTFADAAKSISNGKGTALVTVSDDTYGHGSKRIYN